MTAAKTATLGDVAEVLNGKTPARMEQRPAGHPVLKIRDVDELGRFRGLFESFVDTPLPETLASRQIRLGDTLILNAAHSAGHVASKVYKAEAAVVGALATGEWMIVRPAPERADPAFMYRWVSSPPIQRRIRALVTGIHLYPRDVAALGLELPPMGEQRRIADVLDRADALRTKRRQALAQLDTLSQSVFLGMFGDPVRNPRRWHKLPFEDACPTRLGKMLDQKRQTGEHPRPYLRNANVRWFRFDLSHLLEMDFDAQARAELRLEYGDLLICEGGEPGRAAVWRCEMEECYYQKALHRGRPKPDLAVPEYLVWLLWFLAQRGALVDHTASATIAHLTGERLKAMPIPVPPVGLQRLFAVRIAAVERLRASHEACASRLDALFASLQCKAFREGL